MTDIIPIYEPYKPEYLDQPETDLGAGYKVEMHKVDNRRVYKVYFDGFLIEVLIRDAPVSKYLCITISNILLNHYLRRYHA